MKFRVSPNEIAKHQRVSNADLDLFVGFTTGEPRDHSGERLKIGELVGRVHRANA